MVKRENYRSRFEFPNSNKTISTFKVEQTPRALNWATLAEYIMRFALEIDGHRVA